MKTIPALACTGMILMLSSARSDAQTPSLSDRLAYDATASFDLKELSQEQRGGISLKQIQFTVQKHPVKGILVTPPGKGPFAAILWVHWLGDPATSNRTQFLEEAVALAPKGAVSLLVDAMWSEPGWYKKRIPEEDYAHAIQQTIELRRAADLLLSQPDVDPKRYGFVGHDFGMMYGILANVVDSRARTCVLMAGTSSFNDWYFYAAQPKDPAAYRQQMSVLDPVEHVKSLASSSLFFQFASHDKYVPQEKALRLFEAAPTRKVMAVYDAGHDLAVKQATEDRIAWLIRELALGR